MSLYPKLMDPTISVETPPETLTPAETAPEAFHLQKVGELEAFLRLEVEIRSCLHKKYRRAVIMINGVSATCALFGIGTGAGGAALLTMGVGLEPGLILEGFTVLGSLLDVAGVTISRRCSTKAAKREAIRVLAKTQHHSQSYFEGPRGRHDK